VGARRAAPGLPLPPAVTATTAGQPARTRTLVDHARSPLRPTTAPATSVGFLRYGHHRQRGASGQRDRPHLDANGCDQRGHGCMPQLSARRRTGLPVTGRVRSTPTWCAPGRLSCRAQARQDGNRSDSSGPRRPGPRPGRRVGGRQRAAPLSCPALRVQARSAWSPGLAGVPGQGVCRAFAFPLPLQFSFRCEAA
jgi:hypothetical protein